MKTCRNFFYIFCSQWLWSLIFRHFAPVVALVQRYVYIKLEVTMAFLFQENRRLWADRQTVGWNPRTRLRHVPHRLLQCIVGWGTEGYNWQAIASFECCTTTSQWYEEVWSWTVTAYACRPSLARCSGASKVYKLVTMVYNCLHGKALSYLTDCCTPISDVASRRHLRSASRRQLLVPRHKLSTWLFLSQVRLPGTACATKCVNRC